MDGHEIVSRHLVALCDGQDGVVEVTLAVSGPAAPPVGRVVAGPDDAPLHFAREGDGFVGTASLRIAGVERWWPHTHGAQPRYEVTAEIDGETCSLGSVG